MSELPPARLALPFRCLLPALLFVGTGAHAADPFQDKVLPFLNTYCVKCHNKEKSSGELDLTRYTSIDKLTADFRQWEHVLTFLKKEEMPPAKATQPTPELRAEILTTLEQVLLKEALKLSGDPGVVPSRRLSNAEYDYTIRDISGMDIRPAATFPVDPASGEGFNNTGEALTMSPALFKKYYEAAEFVAEHALLTSTGLKFAPHPVVTFADRQKYLEQAVIDFYEQHKVDYEVYLTALWKYRYRPATRKAAALDEWAAEYRLSGKYARLLWDTLAGNDADKLLLHLVRERWNALPKPKNAGEPLPTTELQTGVRALANEIQQLSMQLAPPEMRLIIPDAGNGPVEHVHNRRKIAATRDQFDPNVLANTRFACEFHNVGDKPMLKLVLQVGDYGSTHADGYVIVKGAFTTNDHTTDGKKRWTLRSLVADRMPNLEFGKHPQGDKIDADALALKTGTTLELEIPANAFPLRNKGRVTFTVECQLNRSTTGIAMVRVHDAKSVSSEMNLRPVIDAKHPIAREFQTSGEAFCKVFPNRFVYVDPTRGLSAGFHLIEGFFRDDQPLCKLALTDSENKELDHLWDELYFGTGIWEKFLRGFVFFERSERNFLKDPAFDDIKEEDPELTKDESLVRFKAIYLKIAKVKATGDELAKHPINVFFEDFRNGLRKQSETLKHADPFYLRDVLAFGQSAFRRPLTVAERQKITTFYEQLCKDKDQGIEAAVRASIVRLLVSPHFCYHVEATPSGDAVAPLSDLALASRLSYFIWASSPDDELLALARSGKLHEPDMLRAQVQRMVKDPKVSRFALEFFGQWLGYRDFLKQETVSRTAFPMFDDALKQAMFEEPTRLITHLIQNDRPITDLLNGDATLVNKKLAQHYGVPFNVNGDEWQLVNGLHERGRSGILGTALILTKNSQPQRTSPVKRGFWVVHKLLGEHIPPPPPDVAVLPAKETDTNGKTIRQLMKLHVEDAKCASCHQRFDPVGLAMEGFDPIGRSRAKDLAGRPVDNVVQLPDGKQARGVVEFGEFLASSRRAEFTKTLEQKFLGYALGRSLSLSDQPLLEKMEAELKAHDFDLSALFEVVALSPQFRNQRCRDFTPSRFKPEPQGVER